MKTKVQEIVLPVNISREIEDRGMTRAQVGYIVALAKSGLTIEELFLERHPNLESLAERIWNHVVDQRPAALENFPSPHTAELHWRALQKTAHLN